MLAKYCHEDDANGGRYMLSYGKKYYLKGGKPYDSVWDVPAIAATSKEHVGYPTQNPIALLQRIILASSNVDDIVFDPFCGFATTCVAADGLDREWTGIDVSEKAAQLVVDRIDQSKGIFCDVIHRRDIPQRTDLGPIPRYNCARNKVQLYGQQRGHCKTCNVHFEIRHLEVDHIIARSKGGTDQLSNLELLC